MSIGAALVTGCTSTPSGPQPMKLCSEYTKGPPPKEMPASRKQMQTALVRAQEYSNLIYGDDCAVCAEVMPSNKGTISLHITSPGPGSDEVNTSAGIDVQARDGKVLNKTQWHSCHMRTTKDKRRK